jgi:nucleotide-binding universal stress UspA family protein
MLRLLVALDFSDCSREALAAALRIAERASPTELVVLTVLDPLDEEKAQTEDALGDMERSVDALNKMVEGILAARGTRLGDGIKVHYTAARGVPAEQIIAQAAAYHVDAIVMGTHGRTGLNRLIAGSVAETVVRHAPCSVLTVKPKRTT